MWDQFLTTNEIFSHFSFFSVTALSRACDSYPFDTCNCRAFFLSDIGLATKPFQILASWMLRFMYILLHVSISLDLAAHMGHSLKLRSLFNYTVIPKEEEIKAKEDTTTQKKNIPTFLLLMYLLRWQFNKAYRQFINVTALVAWSRDHIETM